VVGRDYLKEEYYNRSQEVEKKGLWEARYARKLRDVRDRERFYGDTTPGYFDIFLRIFG